MTKSISEILPKKTKECYCCPGDFIKCVPRTRNRAIDDCLKSLQDAGVAVVPGENELHTAMIVFIAQYKQENNDQYPSTEKIIKALRSYLLGKARMKIGDKVWLFDINRRVYRKAENSYISGGTIYAEHFYQSNITEETTRSWIVDGYKYPKNSPRGLYTDEQKDDAIWEHENRNKISEQVRRCDIDMLKKIDRLLNQPTADGKEG